jgi:hypothetical protein
MLKATWRASVVDYARLNSEEVEEVSVMDEFEDMLIADEELRRWDEEDIMPPHEWHEY